MQIKANIVQCWAVRPAHNSYEFLQLLRRKDDYMGNTWTPVSGGIESGETAWQAALRELKEETGLTAHELYSLDTAQCFYVAQEDALWYSIPFCALIAPGQTITLNDEHQACRWVDRSAIASHLLWAGDRRVAAELCREILDDGPAKPYLKIPL